MTLPAHVRRGFSLIELVIVVVIIGIIAAIAIPRMSRGASAAADNSLASSVSTLRNAIDLYYTEHTNTYPGDTTIAAQLTGFTDEAGDAKTAADSTHIYGPYLRAVPSLPVGAKKGQTGISTATGATIGWIYTAGVIRANTTASEKDVSGKLYSDY